MNGGGIICGNDGVIEFDLSSEVLVEISPSRFSVDFLIGKLQILYLCEKVNFTTNSCLN